MRAVETIKNIWKIEDLRNRILTTLLLVAIYRFGTYVVLPGIDPKALTALQEQTRGGLLALLDMFSGGAFSNASIFALGIMPYISASIVMQLMAIAVPSFQKLQREGESGRRKINQWTRYLTVAILLFQGPTYLVNLSVQLKAAGAALPAGIWFTISSTVILAAGSMFILWLGERITDKGVGNRRLNNSNTKNLEAYIPVPSNGSSIHTLKKLLIFTEYLRLRCFQPLLS